MTSFVPGLELSRRFYHEAVRPILSAEFPDLPHSAAMIGPGSEVLGFDTPMSRDHHWGPRVMLFMPLDALSQHQATIHETLRYRLPLSFYGYPTHFTAADDEGVRHLRTVTSHPVDHRVECYATPTYFQEYLGIDVTQPLDVLDWLTIPMQRLRTVTAGTVYDDKSGELTEIRRKLTFYPDAVWRYMMAAQWDRLGEEEAFMGRCGDLGDELGSRIIAGRQVRDLMMLCFLMERQYAPYAKWFGTAFQQLKCAVEMEPRLTRVLTANNWEAREAALNAAVLYVATMHNVLGITPPLAAEVSLFHGRPFRVIHAGRFAEALLATVDDPSLKNVTRHIGNIDQISDCTAVAETPRLFRGTKTLYQD